MTAPEPYDFIDGYLGVTLLDQAGEISELSAKVERYDLVLCAIERMLSLEIAGGNRLVSAGLVLDHLGAAAQYGASGIRFRCVEDVLADLEAELGRPPM